MTIAQTILAIALALNADGTNPHRLQEYAEAVADTEPHEHALLVALTWAETDFRPNAVSHAGACGILQLMPEDADDCVSVQADQRLCVELALAELRKWRKDCPAFWYLAAWNAGYKRCCGGWYQAKREDNRPGWFQCDTLAHRGFQRKVERRTKIVKRWLAGGLKVAQCADSSGKLWPVAMLPGHRWQEHAEQAGLTCN